MDSSGNIFNLMPDQQVPAGAQEITENEKRRLVAFPKEDRSEELKRMRRESKQMIRMQKYILGHRLSYKEEARIKKEQTKQAAKLAAKELETV